MTEDAIQTVVVARMDELLQLLKDIKTSGIRPFMTTAFTDYTVTEGLLLLIFVVLFLMFMLKLIRRWF